MPVPAAVSRVRPPAARAYHSDDAPARETEDAPADNGAFMTARQKLASDSKNKIGGGGGGGGGGEEQSRGGYYNNNSADSSAAQQQRRTLGNRGGRKFIPPLQRRNDDDDSSIKRDVGCYNLNNAAVKRNVSGGGSGGGNGEPVDERLKNIEPRMIEMITNEVYFVGLYRVCINDALLQMLDRSPQVDWEDIAGLEHAKKSIKEIVVWPMLRPYVFLFSIDAAADTFAFQ